MKQTVPKSEKSANLLAGLLLLGGGILFILLNFSVLPGLGMIRILFLVLSAVFLVKHNQRLSPKKRRSTSQQKTINEK